MATFTDVQVAIENLTRSSFAVSLVMTKQENTELSKGTSPYIKQHIQLNRSSQFDLSKTGTRRNHGSILFHIYTRPAQGAATRNTLQEIVLNSFGSQRVGAATCGQPRMTEGKVQSWDVLTIEVPFYYNNL